MNELTTSILNEKLQKTNKAGHSLIIQSLPKMGTTSIAEAMGTTNAFHEYEMDSLAATMLRESSLKFNSKRRYFLNQRRIKLEGKADICTSMYLLTAELSDQELHAMKITRISLTRSYYPWLRSMVNWSIEHKGHKRKKAWEGAIQKFVRRYNPELSINMPHTFTTIKEGVQLWLPVWITYQAHINSATQEKENIYSQERLAIGMNRNTSSFSAEFKKEFERITKEIKPENQKSKNPVETENTLRQYLKKQSDKEIKINTIQAEH